MFISFCRKFIQETAYQISSESPEFYRRYYKKTFWSFFLDTLYVRIRIRLDLNFRQPRILHDDNDDDDDVMNIAVAISTGPSQNILITYTL